MGKIREYRFSELDGLQVLLAEDIEHAFLKHAHESFILGQVIEGKRIIYFDSVTIEYTPGEVFQIAPYRQHKCCTASTGQNRYCILVIPVEIFTALLALPAESKNSFNAGEKPEDVKLQKLLAEAAELISKEADRELIATCLGKTLCRWSEVICSKCSAGGEIPDRFISAVTYMDENFQDKISLEDIAEAAFMSPYHFQREFVKYFGRSPAQYIEKKDLKK